MIKNLWFSEYLKRRKKNFLKLDLKKIKKKKRRNFQKKKRRVFFENPFSFYRDRFRYFIQISFLNIVEIYFDVFKKTKEVDKYIESFIDRISENHPILYAHYNNYSRFYKNLRLVLIDNFSDFVFFFFISIFTWLFFTFLIPVVLKNMNFFFTIVMPFFILQLVAYFLFFFCLIVQSFLTLLIFVFKLVLSKLMIFQLMPEIILLSSILMVLMFKSYMNNYYDLNYFRGALLKVLGNSKLELLEEGSFKNRLFGDRLCSMRKLYVVLKAWQISTAAVFVSIIWLLTTNVDIVTNQLASMGGLLAINNNYCMLAGMNDIFFGDHFYYDNFVFFARLFILIISLVFLFIFKNELISNENLHRIEFLILVMLGICFSNLMVTASSLLSLFLIIEGLVMIMYILNTEGSLLTSYPVNKIVKFRVIEGSIKYLVTNAVAGSFFLIGSFLIIMFTNGEIYFRNIYSILASDSVFEGIGIHNQLGILLGFLFLGLTFLFKVGLFPFHAWMADLYESSTLGILTFFVLVPKMAILFTIINLYRFFFINFSIVFGIFFVLIGIISIIAGAVMASKQIKINRLIAYSSVSQIGTFFVLLPLISLDSKISYIFVVIFVISYSLVMANFMSILSNYKLTPALNSISLIKEFSFVKFLSLVSQSVFAVFTFNLSGMPPFLGWLLKSLVILAIVLLPFNSFFLFDSVSLSQFGLLLTTIFNSSFFNISAGAISNIFFLLSLVFSLIVFISLVVSIHYSVQLYKVSFSEFNNLVQQPAFDSINNSSLLSSVMVFIIIIINCFSLFGFFNYLAWFVVLFI